VSGTNRRLFPVLLNREMISDQIGFSSLTTPCVVKGGYYRRSGIIFVHFSSLYMYWWDDETQSTMTNIISSH